MASDTFHTCRIGSGLAAAQGRAVRGRNAGSRDGMGPAACLKIIEHLCFSQILGLLKPFAHPRSPPLPFPLHCLFRVIFRSPVPIHPAHHLLKALPTSLMPLLSSCALRARAVVRPRAPLPRRACVVDHGRVADTQTAHRLHGLQRPGGGTRGGCSRTNEIHEQPRCSCSPADRYAVTLGHFCRTENAPATGQTPWRTDGGRFFCSFSPAKFTI